MSLLKNKMLTRSVSRRVLLRGAGVALALPWLESLAPRAAVAQTKEPIRRFLPVFLPNGATDWWAPRGAGGEWSLSAVLDPFADLKAKMSVVTNLENGSTFNADGSNSVEPSHGRQPGAWLTCVNADAVRAELKLDEANGISVDQIMAASTQFKGKTPLPSMQVGLSTVHSSCDDRQCSISRSISWRSATQPLYKMVDPLAVFNAISGVVMGEEVDKIELAKRMRLKKSVLDNVLDNAKETRGLLSTGDRARMDEFLESVRTVEMRVSELSSGMGGLACQLVEKPNMPTVSEDGIKQNTSTYNKDLHANVMNDLIVMAFQCDATRIITYMLEDERSEFTYDHVPIQKFTATTRAAGAGMCGEYHASQHVAADQYATITWYNASKTAELCRKLDAIKEEGDTTILDNCVVLFGGAMHGDDHKCDRLPTALIGSGGGKLLTDQHFVFDKRPIRNLHFTLMNEVFGLQESDFGSSPAGTPVDTLPEILAPA